MLPRLLRSVRLDRATATLFSCRCAAATAAPAAVAGAIVAAANPEGTGIIARPATSCGLARGVPVPVPAPAPAPRRRRGAPAVAAVVPPPASAALTAIAIQSTAVTTAAAVDIPSLPAVIISCRLSPPAAGPSVVVPPTLISSPHSAAPVSVSAAAAFLACRSPVPVPVAVAALVLAPRVPFAPTATAAAAPVFADTVLVAAAALPVPPLPSLPVPSSSASLAVAAVVTPISASATAVAAAAAVSAGLVVPAERVLQLARESLQHVRVLGVAADPQAPAAPAPVAPAAAAVAPPHLWVGRAGGGCGRAGSVVKDKVEQRVRVAARQKQQRTTRGGMPCLRRGDRDHGSAVDQPDTRPTADSRGGHKKKILLDRQGRQNF